MVADQIEPSAEGINRLVQEAQPALPAEDEQDALAIAIAVPAITDRKVEAKKQDAGN